MDGGHTVESGIHPSEIDQQANHSHADSCLFIVLKFVLQDLARLATPSHSVDVDVRKIQVFLSIWPTGKDLSLVFEDELEELILDVLAPQRNAVFLLEMSNLISGVDRPDSAVRLTPNTDGHVVSLLLILRLGLRKRLVRGGAFNLSHLGSRVVSRNNGLSYECNNMEPSRPQRKDPFSACPESGSRAGGQRLMG